MTEKLGEAYLLLRIDDRKYWKSLNRVIRSTSNKWKKINRRMTLTPTVKTGKARAGLDAVTSSAKKLGGGFGKLGGSSLGLASKLGPLAIALGPMAIAATAAYGGFKLMKVGVQSLISVMSAAAKMSVALNARFEQFEVGFGVMLKSGSLARGMLADIRQFAAVTPFEVPQLAQVATQLLGARVEVEKILPMLQKMGDAASGSADGFGALPRVTRAITQMLSKGRLQAEEMMQLAEAGIPAWQALADAMGKSVPEVRKLSEAGKLGREEVLMLVDALGSQFEGMMEKQSKTFSGLVSTFTDQFGLIIQKIGEPFFELIKDGLGEIVDFLDSDDAANWAESLTDYMRATAMEVQNMVIYFKAISESSGEVYANFKAVYGWAIAIAKIMPGGSIAVAPLEAAGGAVGRIQDRVSGGEVDADNMRRSRERALAEMEVARDRASDIVSNSGFGEPTADGEFSEGTPEEEPLAPQLGTADSGPTAGIPEDELSPSQLRTRRSLEAGEEATAGGQRQLDSLAASYKELEKQRDDALERMEKHRTLRQNAREKLAAANSGEIEISDEQRSGYEDQFRTANANIGNLNPQVYETEQAMADVQQTMGAEFARFVRVQKQAIYESLRDQDMGAVINEQAGRMTGAIGGFLIRTADSIAAAMGVGVSGFSEGMQALDRAAQATAVEELKRKGLTDAQIQEMQAETKDENRQRMIRDLAARSLGIDPAKLDNILDKDKKSVGKTQFSGIADFGKRIQSSLSQDPIAKKQLEVAKGNKLVNEGILAGVNATQEALKSLNVWWSK